SRHCARVCRRSPHKHCPGAHPAGRGRAPGQAQRTPTQPAGSAGPAPSQPTTTGPSPTPAPGEPSEPVPIGGSPGELTAPSGPAWVQVTAREYSFTLSRSEVPAGPVVLELVNRGEDAHNLHATEPTEGVEAGALPNTEPGAHPELKVNLRPGTYNLFCSLPGHEAKGMKATLVVR
ncbi:MAG TPA: cupredoxin domain-containing protein, partial [Solirubrobacteraceae bacterium]|nr:cupredoxin domain-containing protein [Solirubrobacteraceae bacterium]